MASEAASFHTGQIVKAIAGREKGDLFVVVGREERSLLLADGKKRRVDRPKRKNPRHIELLAGQGLDHQQTLTDSTVRESIRAAAEGGPIHG